MKMYYCMLLGFSWNTAQELYFCGCIFTVSKSNSQHLLSDIYKGKRQ